MTNTHCFECIYAHEQQNWGMGIEGYGNVSAEDKMKTTGNNRKLMRGGCKQVDGIQKFKFELCCAEIFWPIFKTR